MGLGLLCLEKSLEETVDAEPAKGAIEVIGSTHGTPGLDARIVIDRSPDQRPDRRQVIRQESLEQGL